MSECGGVGSPDWVGTQGRLYEVAPWDLRLLSGPMHSFFSGARALRHSLPRLSPRAWGLEVPDKMADLTMESMVFSGTHSHYFGP